MDDMIPFLRLFTIICAAYALGRLVSKIKLPSILGWLIAGMIFGPYLAGIVGFEIINSSWYKILIKTFECFAGVMIGSEIIFRKLAEYGKQIMVITLFQSLGTFLFVSLSFLVIFAFAGVPLYLAFIFGGIALATAPAPALSIINEFRTEGPVTRTLIPVAAIDDVIGIIVFFTVISIVSSFIGSASVSPGMIILMTVMPFVIGIAAGLIASLVIRKIRGSRLRLFFMIVFLALSVFIGLIADKYVFGFFALNYLLIGMSFSATVANLISEEKLEKILKLYNPLLTLSFVIVIVNLGMPLNYKMILGAGVYTAVYIIARAVGKMGGSYIGGTVSKADGKVTRFLGFTLLPHSGVSLIFTGIAVSMLTGTDDRSAAIVQGTIAAAAIINEIIAVIMAKQGFRWAGEIPDKEEVPKALGYESK